MEGSTTKDRQEALRTIASMISRTENVEAKFAPGTSQDTLQKNRLRALHIAASLIMEDLAQRDRIEPFAREEMRKALEPIASLIRKSEKAKEKVTQGSWQYTMLEQNLKALYLAIPLLEKALREPQ